MKKHSDLEAWIEHAEDDFNNSRRLIRGSKPSSYGTCFHAQQCAEKYMKALLVFKNRAFPLTHDLSLINNLLVQAGIFTGISEDELETLSAYAVAARYPGAGPTVEDAKEAIQIAKTIRKFSRAFLGLK
ncbi:MAG: HEPN domain-containing protein [Chloroflexota bacterium]